MIASVISTSEAVIMNVETLGLRVDPKSEIFDFTKLEPLPTEVSIISGQPAIRFSTDDIKLLLTPEECFRLAANSLTSEEYFSIRNKFGDFYEIHDDFYDPETGEACQPVDVIAPDFSESTPKLK